MQRQHQISPLTDRSPPHSSHFILVLYDALNVMMNVYNLDDEIISFFTKNPSVTKQQCDDFALSHAGGQVNPVQLPGYSWGVRF